MFHNEVYMQTNVLALKYNKQKTKLEVKILTNQIPKSVEN